MRTDYVVPYVDGSDPEWRKIFSARRAAAGMPIDEVELRRRYSANELFRYHFRSVEKYMPWIDTVHLLVMRDSQVPGWIDRDAVHVVRHDEFIPREFLPTFNSGTIECFLHRIPGLAPCFVYANDDMYLFAPVDREQMFDGAMPLVSRKVQLGSPASQYDSMCMGMTRFIYGQLGVAYTPGLLSRSRHGHRAFNSAIYRKIYEKFRRHIDSTCTEFRSDRNTTESFFSVYYDLTTGGKYAGGASVRYFSFERRDELVRFFAGDPARRAQSVCINNNDGDDLLLLSCMEKAFPSKSKYEV